MFRTQKKIPLFFWPITALKLTWMWGKYHPSVMAPPGAWIFLVTLLCIWIPLVLTTVQSFSIPSVIECSMYTLMTAIGVMKVFVTSRGTEKIVALQEYLTNDFKHLEVVVKNEAEQADQQTMNTSSRFCRVFFMSQGQMLPATIIVIAYNVLALPRDQRQLPVLFPEFFVRNEIAYWCMAFLMLFGQCLYILGVGAYDTLFVCLCMQLQGKCRILNHMFARIGSVHRGRIESLVANPREKMREREVAPWDCPDTSRAVQNSVLALELERCVMYHQKLIRLRDGIEDFFSRTALYSLMYFVVALGAPAIRILYDKDIGLGDVLFNFAMALVNLLQLIFLCWFGDKVAESSEQVRDAAFFTYRLEMSHRARSSLVMIMLRTQKPLYITADRLAYLTVELLMSVLRRSNSLYSAAFNLRQ